ncbi:MAG: hypothetical protein ABSC06_30790 [Rhodopila sp.]|jgi:hypothetical protein
MEKYLALPAVIMSVASLGTIHSARAQTYGGSVGFGGAYFGSTIVQYDTGTSAYETNSGELAAGSAEYNIANGLLRATVATTEPVEAVEGNYYFPNAASVTAEFSDTLTSNETVMIPYTMGYSRFRRL